MDRRRLSENGEYFGRFPYGSELLKEVGEFAKSVGADIGYFTVIGAAKSATLAFYGQKSHKYENVCFDEPLEILNCTGNVAYKDSKHFVHAHAVLSRQDGSAIGGHLVSCELFAGELYFKAYDGKIERRLDRETGLYLMDLE